LVFITKTTISSQSFVTNQLLFFLPEKGRIFAMQNATDPKLKVIISEMKPRHK